MTKKSQTATAGASAEKKAQIFSDAFGEVDVANEEIMPPKNESKAQQLRRLKRELKDSVSFEKAVTENAEKRARHRDSLRRKIEQLSK
jgi:hypothetical protein